MADVKTYRAKDVMVIYGAKQLHGFSEDSIVSIKPRGEGTQTYVSADGEVARSMDPDKTIEITVTLAHTSESNDYLSQLYEMDRETGKGMLPISIKDLSGRTLAQASEAWISNHAEVKRDKNIAEQEWVFNTGKANFSIGGND
mgnify:CR=1 FL=1